jgi:hypothetical protein
MSEPLFTSSTAEHLTVTLTINRQPQRVRIEAADASNKPAWQTNIRINPHRRTAGLSYV